MSRRWAAHAALLPLALTVAVAYLGSMLWTVGVSFTSSRTFPNANFVGWAQYERLFDNERWQLAWHNLALYALLFVVARKASSASPAMSLALEKRSTFTPEEPISL